MPDIDIVPPELRAEVEKFDAAAEEIVEAIGRALNAQEPPPIIFHYTDDAGLRGIIESGKFWLTDIFNLNDPSELLHGFSHAIAILNHKASAGQPATKRFAQGFETFGREGGLQASAHLFVLAFSSSGDELGQWRAYADNGRGYALGFDAKTLEAAFIREGSNTDYGNNSFPVIYDDAALKRMHGQIVDLIFPLLTLPDGKDLPSPVVSKYMLDLSIFLSMHVARSALFYKHEAYSNEKEYRFLQMHQPNKPVPDVKFRTRPYSLVRYREFDWRSLAPQALKQIIIGPSADPQRGTQFARGCLRSFYSEDVEIVSSKIPYRAT